MKNNESLSSSCYKSSACSLNEVVTGDNLNDKSLLPHRNMIVESLRLIHIKKTLNQEGLCIITFPSSHTKMSVKSISLDSITLNR